MDLSFKEKSIAGSLLVTAGVLVWYFQQMVGLDWPDVQGADVLASIIGMIVVVVIIEVVLHTVLAVVDQPQPDDERDRLVAARGQRNAYYALFSTSVMAIGYALAHDSSAVLMVHHILLGMLVAEIINFGSQLYYYRAGI